MVLRGTRPDEPCSIRACLLVRPGWRDRLRCRPPMLPESLGRRQYESRPLLRLMAAHAGASSRAMPRRLNGILKRRNKAILPACISWASATNRGKASNRIMPKLRASMKRRHSGPITSRAGHGLLSDMYAKGLGVAADTAKAKAWYQKAAATGNLDAIEALKAMG